MQLNRAGLADKSAWEAKGYALPSFDYETVKKNTKENPFWVHFGVGNIFRLFRQSFPVRRLLPIPSARRQKLRAVSSTDADLRAHETTLFRHLCLFLCHIVAFCAFKVNDSHEIVGNFCKSAQKTVFSSFGRKKEPTRAV